MHLSEKIDSGMLETSTSTATKGTYFEVFKSFLLPCCDESKSLLRYFNKV